MSSSIWTQCAGRSRLRPLVGEAWRVVESQSLISTRALVDSDSEQQVLEEMLEGHKPPASAEPRDLHYLLFTPFRYPPLRGGSRFGTRHEGGIWYGSEGPRTAFAETAYYRLLFLDGTTAELTPLILDFSLFRASHRTRRGIDLTRPPFRSRERWIASPTSYEHSQPLGAAMRADGVEAFLYRSARDPERGRNVGILTPRAFASRRPSALQTWRGVVTREGVQFSKKDVIAPAAFQFATPLFEVAGRIPAPAVG